MAALLNDAAFVQNDNDVSIFNGGQTVSDNNGGFVTMWIIVFIVVMQTDISNGRFGFMKYSGYIIKYQTSLP